MFEQYLAYLAEGLRESETYEELQEKIDYIKDAISDIEDAIIEENDWYED